MVWDLGGLAFSSTELPGKGYAHRRRHLRKATLDHWYITIPVRNPRHAGRDTNPAVPSVHCLARPFEAETEDDAFLTIFVPQDLFSSMPALDGLLDKRVDGGCGLLLTNYMLLLKDPYLNLGWPKSPMSSMPPATLSPHVSSRRERGLPRRGVRSTPQFSSRFEKLSRASWPTRISRRKSCAQNSAFHGHVFTGFSSLPSAFPPMSAASAC